MKVHFSAPLQDLDKHIDDYKLIERTIIEAGHELAKEWLQNYKERDVPPSQMSEEEWKSISNSTLLAIEEADAVIIEASTPSFSMGYISALTLAHKKPLLMLFNSQPQPYILDANNTLRRAEVYSNAQQLKEVLVSFLDDVDVDGAKLRFNMALDRETYNFLNWESVNTGKTKAQIVREVLKERIKRKD